MNVPSISAGRRPVWELRCPHALLWHVVGASLSVGGGVEVKHVSTLVERKLSRDKDCDPKPTSGF